MRGQALLDRLDPAAGLLRLLLLAPAIQAGHVVAVHARDGAQDIGAARPFFAQASDGLQALGQRLLALADVEDVEERRIGLRVERARAAADDEQVVLAAVLRVQRDARQVKRPVTLAEIKAEPSLSKMSLVTSMRLSVQPVTDEEWETVLAMAER